MPGLITTDGQPTSKLEVTPLHATFGAEVSNVDLEHISEDGFQDILALMAKVSRPQLVETKARN